MGEQAAITGAEAILRGLKAAGIDWLFANPGSDFAPVIEAYAGTDAAAIPRPVVAAHENVCISMAHGYWLATGRMQAVAVHVNVGLSNAVMGLLNAHADDVPLFLMSGRTPLSEGARAGARRTPIQYGQEMFDQTALAGETVKWAYELRYAENAADLVARACAIARAEPQGAVYLSLPREPLAETTSAGAVTTVTPALPHPDPQAVRRAAEVLAAAETPLIVCCRGDPEGRAAAELAALAEDNAIAVSEVFVTRNMLASDHPCNVGGDLTRTMAEADAVLVVDCPVAWIPHMVQPRAGAEVIHIGPDPLFSRMPVRGYRTTQAIPGNTAVTLAALRAAMPGKARGLEALRARNRAFRNGIAAKAEAGATGPATKAWVAKCVSEVIGDGTIFSERGGVASAFDLTRANQWFGNTQAGGLGWCLPAALGYQLAHPDRLVACLVGDGCYMFANPVACHQAAQAQGLPLLTVVLNNGSYDAVRLSTYEVHPKGSAAAANAMPMVPFDPVPDYGAIAAACGCHALHVTRAEDLRGALAEAVEVIRRDRRQVLIDVAVAVER